MENLSKSQMLMVQVDYDSIIENQMKTIEDAGFVPQQIHVGRHLFQKIEDDFCERNEIPKGSVTLKTYKGLPIRMIEADSNFNSGYLAGFVFPIQVTMSLPVEPATQNQDEE